MGWLLSLSAFFSGCLLIAIINIAINWDNKVATIQYFSYLFLFITVVAAIYFYCWIEGKSNDIGTVKYKVKNIKRKNLFSTGAMSYYIVPFVSFIPDDKIKTLYILIPLIIAFAILFVRNRMALYTPITDFIGYHIMEVVIICDDGKEILADVLIKDISELYFSSENELCLKPIDTQTYIGVLDTTKQE